MLFPQSYLPSLALSSSCFPRTQSFQGEGCDTDILFRLSISKFLISTHCPIVVLMLILIYCKKKFLRWVFSNLRFLEIAMYFHFIAMIIYQSNYSRFYLRAHGLSNLKFLTLLTVQVWFSDCTVYLKSNMNVVGYTINLCHYHLTQWKYCPWELLLYCARFISDSDWSLLFSFGSLLCTFQQFNH